jgi:hypothetical protein
MKEELEGAVRALKQELDELCRHAAERDEGARSLPVAQALVDLAKIEKKVVKLNKAMRGR